MSSNVIIQDLYQLDMLSLEWSKFNDAGARPRPTSFHSASQYKQFMVVFGGRFNDNAHSNELNVLGKRQCYIYICLLIN